MIERNHTFVADLIFRGYRFMIYVGKEDHAILCPTRTQVPEIVLATMKAWQVAIQEREIEEMASGVDVIDFNFFVDENLFAATKACTILAQPFN